MTKFKKLTLPALCLALVICLGMAILTACQTTTYTVKTEFDSAKGTIAIDPASDDGKYASGTELKVTVTAKTGYKVATFTVNGTDKKSELNGTEYTFKVESDTTLAATFEAETPPPSVESYAVTVSPCENGSVTLDPQPVNGKLDEGTEVTVTVTADSGYKLATFTVNGDDKMSELDGNEYTFTVSGATTIAATFEAENPSVESYDITVTPCENGSITLDPQPVNGKLDEGTEVTVTVTADTGYKLKTFTVNGDDKMSELDGNEYTFTVSGATTIAATFEAESPSVESYDITVTPCENGSVTLDPQPVNGKLDEGTEVTVTVTADQGYALATFTVNGDDKMSELDGNEYTFTVSEATTIAATFEVFEDDRPLITVENTHCTVTFEPELDGGRVESGTSVTITATPEAGYDVLVSFKIGDLNVRGQVQEADGKYTYTREITADTTISVVFAQPIDSSYKQTWKQLKTDGSFEESTSNVPTFDDDFNGITIGASGYDFVSGTADAGYEFVQHAGTAKIFVVLKGDILVLTGRANNDMLFATQAVSGKAVPQGVQDIEYSAVVNGSVESLTFTASGVDGDFATDALILTSSETEFAVMLNTKDGVKYLECRIDDAKLNMYDAKGELAYEFMKNVIDARYLFNFNKELLPSGENLAWTKGLHNVNFDIPNGITFGANQTSDGTPYFYQSGDGETGYVFASEAGDTVKTVLITDDLLRIETSLEPGKDFLLMKASVTSFARIAPTMTNNLHTLWEGDDISITITGEGAIQTEAWTQTLLVQADGDNFAIFVKDGNESTHLFFAKVEGETLTLTDTSGTVRYTLAKGELPVEMYEVSASAGENGSISLEPQPTEGKLAEGTFVTVTVEPADGYTVDTFTVNGDDKKSELVGNEYTFTVRDNTTIAVTFKQHLTVPASYKQEWKQIYANGKINKSTLAANTPTIDDDTLTFAKGSLSGEEIYELQSGNESDGYTYKKVGGSGTAWAMLKDGLLIINKGGTTDCMIYGTADITGVKATDAFRSAEWQVMDGSTLKTLAFDAEGGMTSASNIYMTLLTASDKGFTAIMGSKTTSSAAYNAYFYITATLEGNTLTLVDIKGNNIYTLNKNIIDASYSSKSYQREILPDGTTKSAYSGGKIPRYDIINGVTISNVEYTYKSGDAENGYVFENSENGEVTLKLIDEKLICITMGDEDFLATTAYSASTVKLTDNFETVWTSDAFSLEIKADGAVGTTGSDDKIKVYLAKDNGTDFIILMSDADGKSHIYTCKIEGETLTLTGTDGQVKHTLNKGGEVAPVPTLAESYKKSWLQLKSDGTTAIFNKFTFEGDNIMFGAYEYELTSGNEQDGYLFTTSDGKEVFMVLKGDKLIVNRDNEPTNLIYGEGGSESEAIPESLQNKSFTDADTGKTLSFTADAASGTFAEVVYFVAVGENEFEVIFAINGGWSATDYAYTCKLEGDTLTLSNARGAVKYTFTLTA